MAKSAKLSDSDQVSAHIKKLDPTTGKIVQFLRETILATNEKIGERIKWNSPSFYYTGEMKESDPKEYKRELIVFNLFKNRIMMVFPSGARLNDKSGFLEGDYKDGRRLAIIKDMADAKAREKKLQTLVKTWIKTLDS